MNIRQASRAAELLIDLAELLSTEEVEIEASALLHCMSSGILISQDEAKIIESQIYT